MAARIPEKEVKAMVTEPSSDHEGYYLHHVCKRIKDPRKTVDFYTRILGMRLFGSLDLSPRKITMYFIGYASQAEMPKDGEDSTAWILARRTCMLEFMHCWGSEDEKDLKYHDGNLKPKGYSHICMRVPDIDKAVRKLEENGVTIVKRHDEGCIHGYSYFEDPDGYWVEFLADTVVNTEDEDNARIKEAFSYK